MKLRLIDNWKKAWKLASVQINAVGLVFMAIDFIGQTWNSLPPFIQQKIPNASTIALVLFALGIVGRLIKQRGKANDDDSQG